MQYSTRYNIILSHKDFVLFRVVSPQLVLDVAEAHVEELIEWFVSTVAQGVDEVLWIDIHRQSRKLISRIKDLDTYIRQLKC